MSHPKVTQKIGCNPAPCLGSSDGAHPLHLAGADAQKLGGLHGGLQLGSGFGIARKASAIWRLLFISPPTLGSSFGMALPLIQRLYAPHDVRLGEVPAVALGSDGELKGGPLAFETQMGQPGAQACLTRSGSGRRRDAFP